MALKLPISVDSPLVLVPQYFGSIVYDRRTCQYLPFDHEATSIFHALSSSPLTRLLEISRSLASRSNLLSFFDQYYALGFFTIDERFAGEIIDIKCPTDHLVGPLTVHLEVTARCNLRCSHCFADAPSTKDELSLEELDGMFAEMAASGSFRLGLTGGEPLMRKDIIEIVSLAESHGLSPCLTTNGLLVSEPLAAALAHHNLAWLNVSLEGATSASHDAVRGAGTFEQVMRAVGILRRHVPFSLAFTVTRHNYREVQSCARLAQEVGAQAAVFRPLYPVGRARQQNGISTQLRRIPRGDFLSCGHGILRRSDLVRHAPLGSTKSASKPVCSVCELWLWCRQLGLFSLRVGRCLSV